MRTEGSISYGGRIATAIGLLFVVALAATVSAHVYVSLNGGFYVEYPDEWWQVDYQTVDYYLSQLQADPETYNYDAVFSARKIPPFYDHEYCILTVDTTTGEFSRRERDSVVADLGDLFGETINYRPIQESFAALQVDDPSYDRDRQLFVRLSDVGDDQEGFKKHLYVIRFYERGTAHFYFFAPDSTFDQYRPEFYNILASFSTENIDSHMPKESVKLADPDKVQSTSDGSGANRTWLFGAPIGFIVVLIIVMASRRKKKREKK